jgi:hypothetical protein
MLTTNNEKSYKKRTRRENVMVMMMNYSAGTLIIIIFDFFGTVERNCSGSTNRFGDFTWTVENAIGNPTFAPEKEGNDGRGRAIEDVPDRTATRKRNSTL